MATLEKIRSKAGLLVIVVGIALFAFIIGDFLQSGSTFFRQSKEKIADVDGQSIDIREYQSKISEMEEVYKLQTGSTAIPEETMTQIRESVYQMMVKGIILGKEAEKVGLNVGKEELSDLIMGTNISPVIMQLPMFQNPQTRSFDRNMLVQFLKTIETDDLSTYTPEQQEQLLTYKKFWMFWEQNIKDQKLEEKYNALISKSIVANSLDAKANFDDNRVSVDFDYVVRPYSAVSNDQVTVSDSDIKKLYDARKEGFKQDDTQVLSVISVNIAPSQDDFNSILSRLEEIKPAFTAQSDVADIVNDHSDVPYANAFQSLAEMPETMRVFAESATIGDVHGPVLYVDEYNMVKLIDKTVASDSIRLNQVMISAPTEEQLNHLADSLVAEINNGTPFARIASQLTNGQSVGDMGWATELSLLRDADEKFRDGAFDAPLNKAIVVKSGQGTHIVQVTERTSPVTKYKLATIEIQVTASTETYKKLYSDLNQYVATYNSLDSFQLAASKYNYYCNTGVPVGKSEQSVMGITKSRPVIRWAFEHKKGDVSDIFECDGRFVVAAVEKSLKKGYRPLEDVAETLKTELLNDKKAELIIGEVNAKPQTTLEQYAQDLNGTVQNVKFVTFATPSISGIGMEPVLNANALSLEPGKISGPLKGKTGVYIIKVLDKKETPGEFDAVSQKQGLNADNAYRIGYQAVNSLIRSSDVTDNRITFF